MIFLRVDDFNLVLVTEHSALSVHYTTETSFGILSGNDISQEFFNDPMYEFIGFL